MCVHGALCMVHAYITPSLTTRACRIQDGHLSVDLAFTTEAAVTLARRGTQQTEGGYQFSRDLRVKAVRWVSCCEGSKMGFLL